MGLLTRRETLKVGAGMGVAFGCVLLGAPAVARPEVDEIVAAFTGGLTPDTAGITLDVPVLADNANAVTVGVRIDEPMTDEFFCEELVLITEANPRPLAATFRFSPRAGVADIGLDDFKTGFGYGEGALVCFHFELRNDDHSGSFGSYLVAVFNPY